ncbi:uncharacterized protein LOC132061207 [Lycium ferocissimum]|uniref:uncharacterized protein LOC132061207 n=1 Tax=Lycium ferocissimum TaxID=112874 RepID=UPI002814FB67|nr:uncharacterized protein LOC132061207 [Lycium ferocissimum]
MFLPSVYPQYACALKEKGADIKVMMFPDDTRTRQDQPIEEIFEETGINGTQLDRFSIKFMYNKLRGDFAKVPWRKMICNNQGAPKWIFITYLAVHGKLYTRDRLLKWGIIDDAECAMCGLETESTDHLCFKCPLSAGIWGQLLQWQGYSRPVLAWKDEQEWQRLYANGKNSKDEMYRVTLTGCIYMLWHERNCRIFQQKMRTVNVLTTMIILKVICRETMKPKLTSRVMHLNTYL